MRTILDIRPDEFTDLVRKGRGTAVLALRRQEPQPFRSVIETACRRHYCHLKSDEACRADYVYDLMTASGEFSSLRPMVLDALEDSSDWLDRSQLFKVAMKMAKEGDPQARIRAREAFSNGMQTRGDATGGDEIIEEGGSEGLLFVLRQFARRRAMNYLGEVPAWIEALELTHGEEVAREAEDYCRSEDTELKALMEWADSSADIRAERWLPRASYGDFESLKSFMDQYGFRHKDLYVPKWSMDATDGQVARAASEMLGQTDWEILTTYLEIFSHRDTPLGPELIFDYATHENDAVSSAALTALARFEGADIRSFALRLLARDAPRPEALLLLTKNYRDPDALLIRGLLGTISDPDHYERLCTASVTVFEENLVDGTVSALLLLYENSLCPMCRYHAVEMLKELDRLPPWMGQECRLDSFGRTRELFADFLMPSTVVALRVV